MGVGRKRKREEKLWVEERTHSRLELRGDMLTSKNGKASTVDRIQSDSGGTPEVVVILGPCYLKCHLHTTIMALPEPSLTH